MLTVITGNMSSGKTRKVIDIATEFVNKNVVFQVFNMVQDTRSPNGYIKSWDGTTFPALTVEDGNDLINKLACNTKVVILDEAQFCNETILELYKKLSDNDIDLIVSGLQYSFNGKDFGYINTLMEEADIVYKYFSTCYKCGCKKSDRVIRLENNEPVDLEGELVVIEADYKSICKKCFTNIYKNFTN